MEGIGGGGGGGAGEKEAKIVFAEVSVTYMFRLVNGLLSVT